MSYGLWIIDRFKKRKFEKVRIVFEFDFILGVCVIFRRDGFNVKKLYVILDNFVELVV